MTALLIHFLGFLLINSAIPARIESADAYFLAAWYAAFAAVDLVALTFAKANLRLILALSFAWSSALALECFMLQDTLQRNDWLIQSILDIALFSYMLIMLIKYKSTTNPKGTTNG